MEKMTKWKSYAVLPHFNYLSSTLHQMADIHPSIFYRLKVIIKKRFYKIPANNICSNFLLVSSNSVFEISLMITYSYLKSLFFFYLKDSIQHINCFKNGQTSLRFNIILKPEKNRMITIPSSF